jgi:hypothetical protein
VALITNVLGLQHKGVVVLVGVLDLQGNLHPVVGLKAMTSEARQLAEDTGRSVTVIFPNCNTDGASLLDGPRGEAFTVKPPGRGALRFLAVDNMAEVVTVCTGLPLGMRIGGQPPSPHRDSRFPSLCPPSRACSCRTT